MKQFCVSDSLPRTSLTTRSRSHQKCEFLNPKKRWLGPEAASAATRSGISGCWSQLLGGGTLSLSSCVSTGVQCGVFGVSGPGIAINSISISSAFCATGSEDGYLRLWPLDFSAVVLEAGE